MGQTFDTLEAARKLEAAGMRHEQAEAVAEIVRNVQNDFGHLATKADLAATRSILMWMIGLSITISLATFATVVILAINLP